MKTSIISSLLLSVLLFSACGEKVSHCDTTDPIGELAFLQEIVAGDSAGTSGVSITEYRYKGETYFDVNCCEGASDSMSEIYDCEGNLFCRIGGIAGFECGNFSTKAEKVAKLYP